jgi:plastocyanin
MRGSVEGILLHGWRARSVRGLALAGALLAVTAGTVGAANAGVSIANFAFAPQSITVHVGDTVTWTNNDTVGHTATADAGSFDTGTIAPGSSASVTVHQAGTFTYHCAIHRSMTGTIVVEAAPAASAAAPSAPATDTAPAPGPSSSRYAWIVLVAATLVIAATLYIPTARSRRRR